MPARRDNSSQQIVAVLFIALLAGGECTRISEQAAVFSSAQELINSHQSLSRQAGKGGPAPRGIHWWHNDVCRSREMNAEDPSAAASRYIEKYVKLHTLSIELHADSCSKGGCPARWIELKSRLQHFNSCVQVLSQTGGKKENATEAPALASLVEAMKSQSTSLMTVFATSLATVGSAMEKKNMFPAGEKCSFNPSQLNVTAALEASADPEAASRAMRAQLFGEECDEEAATQYLETLSDAAKRTASSTMAVVKRVVEMTKTVQSTKPDATEIDKAVQDAAKDTSVIVETAKSGVDDKGGEQLADKQVEELVEIKEAYEDSGTSPPAALLEVDDANAMQVSDYTYFEFFIGIIVFILIMAFIGVYGGQTILAWQASWAAGAAR